MRETIQQLMTDLSALTSPFNPVDLKKIFDRYPMSGTNSIPPQLAKHVEQLTALSKLVDLSFNLALQRHSLNIQQKNLESLISQDKEIQTNIRVFHEQIIKSAMAINSSFQEIMPLINEALQKQNPLAQIYSSSADTKTKINAVEQFYKQLSKISREFDTPSAKLRLLQLKNRITHLIFELGTLGVICSADNGIDRFHKISSSVTLTIKQLKEVQPKIIELQKNFAQQISANDVKLKIQEIESQSADVVKELELTQLEISINTLEIVIKDRLQQEFKLAPDKAGLLINYENKIDSAYSYANPYAWREWWQDSKKYDEEQAEYRSSVSFLNLLAQELKLQKSITYLLKQKNALTELPMSTPSSAENTDDISKLIAQAKILFAEYQVLNKPGSLQSSTSASDFYLVLLANIPIVELKLEHKNSALIKLGELILADTELDQLRTQFEFWADNDSLLPSETELIQLVSQLQSQNPAIETVENNLDLCKSFLDNAKKFQLLVKQHIDALSNKKVIENKLESAKIISSKQDQLSNISDQLSALQNEIGISIDQIKLLTLPSKLQEQLVPTSELLTPKQTLDLSTSLINSIDQQSSNTLDHTLHEPPSLQPIIVYGADKVLKKTLSSEELHDKLTASFVQIDTNLEQSSPLLPKKSDKRPHHSAPTTNSVTLKPIEPNQNEKASEQSDSVPHQDQPLDTHATHNHIPPELTLQESRLDSVPLDVQKIAQSPLKARQPLEQPQNLQQVVQVQPLCFIENKMSNENPEPSVIHGPNLNDSSHHSQHRLVQNNNFVLESSSLSESPEINDANSESSIHESPGLASPLLAADRKSVETPVPLEDIPLNPKIPLTKQQIESQKRHSWHQQNLRLLQKQPSDVQEWYQNTYIACNDYLITNPASFKPSYLLRDILFELEHKLDLNIIRAYMRLCPNPAKDINNLLSLKPDLPLVHAPFDEKKELQDAPSELKPLYAQYIKLKQTYPVESELILQAIRSVRTVKLFMSMQNAKISTAHFPSLSQDPRFEPLQRHRGFFKIWEALEDFFRLIIGKVLGQAEYEFTKKPCFFKTKSAQLIEEADRMIQADLPPMCSS